jgi:CRP/FNR family transcriptional regulator
MAQNSSEETAEYKPELIEAVEAIASQELDQRLAAQLLYRDADGGDIHTKHQALADALGSVGEIPSRLLRGFAERG